MFWTVRCNKKPCVSPFSVLTYGSLRGPFMYKKFARHNPANFPRFPSFVQIVFDEFLKQLIPVDMADQGTGIVVVRDIRGIFGQNIPDDLVHRILPLHHQRIVHRVQDLFHLCLRIESRKLSGCICIVHCASPLC